MAAGARFGYRPGVAVPKLRVPNVKGFSPAVRAIIVEREGGRCARCGAVILTGGQCHHRRPRGLGGASYREATNLPANGGNLCVHCHSWVENDRTAAKAQGWLVEPWDLPADIPVLYRGEWMLLDDDGSINAVQTEELNVE
jgi:5-methylcytosine-specific restriction protein A